MIMYRTKDNDLLDEICWKQYGYAAGSIELVLKANPGLALLFPIFSAGRVIMLPDIPSPVISPKIRLWD